MKDLRVEPKFEKAQVERGPAFEFSFEGKPIAAYPGETLGAALMAADIVTFRTTRHQGKPRGLFCGIGVCFDCLLVVDGAPNQRACLTPARPGADVRVQTGTADDFYSFEE